MSVGSSESNSAQEPDNTDGTVEGNELDDPDSPEDADDSTAEDDYVLPESDARPYATSKLEHLGFERLYQARNELFARHGARFGDKKLQQHFDDKPWYQGIKPKLDDYDTDILNLIESTNAMTIRRIELEHGSPHVNPLDDKRAAMLDAYGSKAAEYLEQFGPNVEAESDSHAGLTGLCLAQLVDFEKDGWEELLVVYHDGDAASAGGFFDPSTYKVEVWSYENGHLSGPDNQQVQSTQGGSSYLLINGDDNGYAFGGAAASEAKTVAYYPLSKTFNPTMGEGYWSGMADLSFSLSEVQTITSETMRNLGQSDAYAGMSTIKGSWPTVLSGTVLLENEGGKTVAKLDLDPCYCYKDERNIVRELDEAQVEAASEATIDWAAFDGQHVVIRGGVQELPAGQTRPTQLTIMDASLVDSGEASRSERRDEVADAFIHELRTNYIVEDGKHVHYDSDIQPYVSPTSELYQWKDGNDKDEEILILGDSCRVKSSKILDAIGDTYIMLVQNCYDAASSDSQVDEFENSPHIYAVVFNDDDLVQHAYT